jgi:phage shock protein C
MEKRLVRKNKQLFGVCGGLADYFGLDPTLIRVLFVAGVVLFGSGILLYLILALIMPEEKPSSGG